MNILNRIRNVYSTLFPDRYYFLFSVCIGLSVAFLHHLIKLQHNFFSWRYLGLSAFILTISTLIVAILNRFMLAKRYLSLPRLYKYFVLIISIFFGIVLLVQTKMEYPYFLLPKSHLEIQFNIEDLEQVKEGVRLVEIRTKWGNESFNKLSIDGIWEKHGDYLFFPSGQNVHIYWEGRAIPWSEVNFYRTVNDQTVTVSWNGEKSVANLRETNSKYFVFHNKFIITNLYFIPYTLSFIFSIGYFFFVLLLILSNTNYFYCKKPYRKTKAWLLFMLPMLTTWVFTLLVFWPGILSSDSIAQWKQALTGNFNNWHPAFHTIILAVLMRLWYSPAIIALTQIILLALVVSWGLDTLFHYGVHKLILWIISFCFALSPIISIQVITLWKDIPYAISVLWMTILLLRIVLSHGSTNQHTHSWIILGLAGFCVSIFRKNGYPLAVLILILMLFIYKTYWKQFLGSLLTLFFIFMLINGPLYRLLRVNNNLTGQENLILLHHISAHIQSETPLKEDERKYIEELLPIDEWDYECCTVRPISRHENFNRSYFLKNRNKNLALAFSLFTRNPMVSFKHIFCASDLVWRIFPGPCHVTSIHAIHKWNLGEERWISGNPFGIREESQIPSMISPYLTWLKLFGFNISKLVYYLRPALWLYVLVFCLAVQVIKKKDLRFFMAGSLIILQALLLIMISFTSNFRYLFSTNLVGLFSLGWLFIGRNQSDDSPASNELSHSPNQPVNFSRGQG